MINKQLLKKILVMMGMMTLIGGIFTAIMTYVNIGFSDNFFIKWSESLIFAVLFMMPLGGVFMFLSNKFIKFIFPNLRYILQNILVGICMALCMESIMAISTTINIIGYPSFELFSSFWLKSYLAALPFALIFSPIMTIVIKPKIEKFLA
ncbi:DUF2798 domain-containing protein [Arcobacter sp. s6]|jgi:hypothetical protein|uniref:DUF2798 domain-containing protein n=1 Tax=Arcobacter sp. s6 TaxID=3230363 RepID=UPI0034A05723